MTRPASPATAARARASLGDLEFTIIDTAGLDEGAKGSLTARMQEQTETAIGLRRCADVRVRRARGA